jgi:hypothetical protein
METQMKDAHTLMLEALLMVEWGSLADVRCPDCRSKPPSDAEPALPIGEGSPLVIGAPKMREHYVTSTGHYADVECSVDLALNSTGFDTREKRDAARLKLISGAK